MRYAELFEAITYKQLPGEEFYQSLVDNKTGKMEANKRIKYLSRWNDWASELDFAAYDGDKVVGAAGVHPSRDEERVIAIWFLSVDPDYQGQGIAKTLAEMVFKYAAENNLRVRSSSYTEMGAERLKHHFEALAQKYKVPFKDGTDHYLFDYQP